MQNPSRRAFLGGKAPELQPWERFLLELQRKTQGSVRAVEANSEQALCTVQQSTDIHHARQLCQMFGVKLYVGDGSEDVEWQTAPILWLDLSHLNQLLPVNDDGEQWFMQSGVSVGQLRNVGFAIPDTIPAELWVAQWLGLPHYQSYTLQHIEQSGLVHASLLMADGTSASLGPFGVQNTKPLNTAMLRTVIPQLFQLAHSVLAQRLLVESSWPGKYRLDLFSGQNPCLNLAHVLLGAEQDLGLLEWVVMDKSKWQAAPLQSRSSALSTEQQINAQELDAAIKAIFDPGELFCP